MRVLFHVISKSTVVCNLNKVFSYYFEVLVKRNNIIEFHASEKKLINDE